MRGPGDGGGSPGGTGSAPDASGDLGAAPPPPGRAPRPLPVGSDRDPGLQPERTRLAWRRTTLSCAVTVVLALRQVLRRGSGGVVAALATCLVMLFFLLFLWLANRRMRELGASRPRAMAARVAAAVAGCAVALAVFGAAVVW